MLFSTHGTAKASMPFLCFLFLWSWWHLCGHNRNGSRPSGSSDGGISQTSHAMEPVGSCQHKEIAQGSTAAVLWHLCNTALANQKKNETLKKGG